MKVIFFTKKNDIPNIYNKKIDLLSVNSLLSAKDIENCIEGAFQVSIDWNRNQESLFISGENLIESAQLFIYNYMYDLLIAEKILFKLNQINDKEIYLNCDKNFSKNLIEINSFYHFDFKFKDSFSNSEDLSFKNRIKKLLKDNFFDNYFKYIFSKKSSKALGKSDILIFADVYNKPTNENLYIVYQSLKEHFETELVSSEFRIKNAFFKGNGILLGNFINLRNIVEFIKEKKLVKKQYVTFKVNISLFKSDSLNKHTQIVLGKALKKYFTSCIIDTILIRDMFKQITPKVLILGTDCHKLSRQAAILSKKKIHSLVIQHGATNGKHGFAPLYADKIAVWGNISRNTLISWGINPESIEVTGNPRYDRNFNFPVEDQKGKKILLALSPYDNKTQEDILEIISGGLEKVSDAEIIIRPHPSDININIYSNFIKNHKHLNVTIDNKTSLTKIFNEVRVVISAQSTIGIEALLQNKNLIEINHPRIPIRIPYEKYNCSFVVNDKKDLINALTSIYKNDDICKTKTSNSRAFLDQYVGSIQGDSLKKIRDVINSWI
jgi:hypothetical protein